jgi:hypothetical protein
MHNNQSFIKIIRTKESKPGNDKPRHAGKQWTRSEHKRMYASK